MRKILLMMLLIFLFFSSSSAFLEVDSLVYTKDQIIVAVLDSGIDLTHPKLKDYLLYNENKKVVGYNFINHKKPPMDDNGHGTHVAGIIIKQSDDKVRLLPLKVLNEQGQGKVEDTANGIRWAVDHGAKITIVSLGTPFYNEELAKSVVYAWNKGSIVISATGNYGAVKVTYPAGNLYAIGVSAGNVNENGKISLWKYSNTGRHISYIAPEESLSTLPTFEVYVNKYGFSLEQDVMNGTSQASAYLAGLIGKYWSENPSLTNKQIYQNLLSFPVYKNIEGWSSKIGFGFIDRIPSKSEKIYKFTKGGIYGQVTDSDMHPLLDGYFLIDNKQVELDSAGMFRIWGIEPGLYSYIYQSTQSEMRGMIQIKAGNEFLLHLVLK